MTLVLTLYCCTWLGCLSTQVHPSVAVTPQGNAILCHLPVGTLLSLPSPKEAAQLRALLVNESTSRDATTLELKSPMKLATPAYILDRDYRELELVGEIKRLKAK